MRLTLLASKANKEIDRHFFNFVLLGYIFNVVLLCQVWAQNTLPVVSNITAQVDTQNSIVAISFNLWDDENDTMSVSLKISNDNGLTYLFNGDSTTGDIGYPILSGTQKQVFWHYTADSTNVCRAKIVADDLYEINISDIVATVDSLNLLSDLTVIEGVRHRTAGISHLDSTISFIESQFVQNSLQVSRHEFSYGNYEAVNLIGRLPGQTEEEIVFIIDGHFDTVSNTPGADDNGSGVVGMLEAMRVLAQYNFKHTIKFISFDLEETGLIGSSRYVSEGLQANEQIEGVFNFEMIGYYSDEPGSQLIPVGFDILFPAAIDSIAAHDYRGNYISNIANVNSNSLKSQFDNYADLYVPELRVISLAVPGNGEIAPDLRRSDHAPFWDAGYRALMLTDGSEFRNFNYHSPSDTLGTLNFRFMSNVVKATVATVSNLAEIIHCGVGVSDEFTIPYTQVSIMNSLTLDRFYLAQNHPNPFNPTTIIRYELPEQAYVNLSVYDLLGREVITLVSRVEEAGEKSVQWDATNNLGQPVSAGMYFYRIKAGNFFQTKQMVLLE